MEETGKTHIKVETRADVLHCDRAGEYLVEVDMGIPRFDWRAIPLAKEADVTNIPFIRLGLLVEGVAMSMGNPHIAFIVDNVDAVPLETSGPKVENHPLFPERTNAEAVQVLARDHLKVRVWERGAGETMACGTGACAAMVAARIRGLVDSKATVSLPGGDLIIEWAGEDISSRAVVRMTGPVAKVFEGTWKPA
jgi:diaminopimelate epimerase